MIFKYMTDFQLLVMIGNDCAAVHLAASTHHSQYTTNRDNLTVRLLKADIILFPRIFVTVDRHGNRLGIIAAGAAAHSQQKIHMVLSGNPDTLPQLLYGRIRHHAAILDNYLAIGFQKLYNLIVNAIALDGTAAVNQLNGFSVFGKFLIQRAKGILSKIKFRRI